MKKKALWLIFIFLIGILLTSCSITRNVSTVLVGKECDIKLNSGIINGNLEQVKEALEDGANINKIKLTLTSEENPVILAITKNHEKIAEYLIKNGADANYTDNSGRSLLMFSAYNTDDSFCELLIKYGAKINQEDKKGYTAIEYALDHSRRDTTENNIDQIITLLLQNGAKIRPVTLKTVINGGYDDGENRYWLTKRILGDLIKEGYKSGLEPVVESAILGETSKVAEFIKANKVKKEDEQQILFYTTAFGNVETIELFEKERLDLKSCDKLDNTLLIVASQYGNLEFVKYLLEKGIDIEAQNKQNNTALIAAAMNNQYKVVEYLMQRKAKTHIDNKYYLKDALCIASSNGDIELMKILKTNGYPFNNDSLGPAMGAASQNDKVESLKYLIENGANVDQEYNGYTTLEDACLRGNIDVVKFLVESGAKIDGKDSNGEPLITAAKFGNTEIIEYLIKKGANVNAAPTVKSGEQAGLKDNSALITAIISGNLDIVKLLVENGAELEDKNNNAYNGSAIIWAADQGSRHIVEYLIQKGSKIDYQNDKGQTALMRAASQGQLDNVKVLIKYKANTSLKDKEEHTAQDLARAGKYKDIVDYLESTK